LATLYLAATDSPAGWVKHWRERAWTRALLARCRGPRYALKLQATRDLETLVDLLAEVEKTPATA
jgi:hypothetical protein